MSGTNRKLRAVAVAAALVFAAHGAQAALWGGSEYDVVTSEGITWSNAKAATDSMGSGWHLATIRSVDEDAFVSSLLPASPASRSHYWLGATDAANEGTWQWVTGEAWSYTHWWGGEPNNVSEEDFLGYDYRSGWAWNDAADDLQRTYAFVRGYVIERAVASAVPLPATLPLLGLGFAVASWVSRRKPAG